MDEHELDRRLRRLRDAAGAATRPRDPHATERRGRRRQRLRRLGSGAALLVAAAAAILVLRDGFATGQRPSPPPAALAPAAPTTRPPVAQAQPLPAGGGEAAADSAEDGPAAPEAGRRRPDLAGGPPATEPGKPAEPLAADGDSGGIEAQSGKLVTYGGLGFLVPVDWLLGPDDGCPDAGRPEVLVLSSPDPAPAALASPPPCPEATDPFAILRSQPAFSLPGGTLETIDGLRVLVRQDAPPDQAGVRVASGWTVSQAVVERPDGGVLLVVGEPGQDTVRLFRGILGSVHPA
ncbi:MAG TPA: hypothetical protein VKG45_04385 [Actinomycetes bacterium]|nr:hypothetical protein [Actinomycetes bacterium]